jgi:ornithine carbamoyltransferase
LENLLSISDLKPKEFNYLLERASKIKLDYKKYARRLFEKTLLMIFEAPSLRTRISFEVAMTQLHGGAINYYAENSPWGLGKESIEDVAKTISQYCDIVSARIYSHSELKKLAKNSKIPVINMMTNDGHPCQILGDFLTIKEYLGSIKNIKIAYLGDAKNNVTYSLMRACALTGNKLSIACPKNKEYYPAEKFIKETKRLEKKHKGKITITQRPEVAVRGADIIYTDSWMSYRIPQKEKERRINGLKKYQVNKTLFKKAKKKTLFMHCLPAMRGHEVTKEIIDSKASIVFPQAQNRLHIQKSILLSLMGR